MSPGDVHAARDLLSTIDRLDKLLKAGKGPAEMKVETWQDLGQKFYSGVELPAEHWRFAITGYRRELIERLRAIGVDVEH